jgi:hypothetical protein
MANPPLLVGAYGDDVARLHRLLRQQGYQLPASEVDRNYFGAATRQAVLEFQQRNGLEINGIIDEHTAAAIDSAVGTKTAQKPQYPFTKAATAKASPVTLESSALSPGILTPKVNQPRGASASTNSPALSGEGESFVVHGQVTLRGLPVPGITVLAGDADVRGLEALGRATTNDTGSYSITYKSEQFGRAEKGTADLRFTLLDANGKEIEDFEATDGAGNLLPTLPLQARHRDGTVDVPIRYNAQQEEIINIEIVPGAISVPSEYERLLAELEPLLVNVSAANLFGKLADLQEFEITFLAGETGEPRAKIEALVTAIELSHDPFGDDVDPAMFYGLSVEGLPLDLSVLAKKSRDEIKNALEKACDDNIIPESQRESIDNFIDTLLDISSTQALQTSVGEGRASLGEFLDVAKLPAEFQTTFVTAYSNRTEAIEAFWKSLRQQPGFQQPGVVENLQFTFQLGLLTQNHLPLVQDVVGSFQPALVADLVKIDKVTWTDLVNNNGVPPGVSGSTLEEQVKNYVDGIVGSLQVAFPTGTTAHIVANNANVKIDPQTRTNLTKFFTNAPDFDLRASTVTAYIAQHSDSAFNGIAEADRPMVVQELKRLHRLFQVSSSADALTALLTTNLDSAWSIATMPRTSFLAQYKDALGGEVQAGAIHERAMHIHARSVFVYTHLRQSAFDVQPRALGNTAPVQEALKQLPNYRELFGSIDFCDCKDCRSVLSPAAYFVDLLEFLRKSTPNNSGLKLTPLNILLGVQKGDTKIVGRRPDLAYIKLNCENTNTLIPYVDLVNEILETFIASNPPNTTLGNPPNDSTDGVTADELAANPENTNEDAYRILDEAVYPFTLPFNLPLETARVYLEFLGSSLYEVMKVFRKEDTGAALRAIDAEFLKITPEEYKVLTGKNFDGTAVTPAKLVQEFYGYDTAVVSADTVWVDDSLPDDAQPSADADSWNWVTANPAPISGTQAHQSVTAAGFHQHYFQDAADTLLISPGDRLFTQIFLDPGNLPEEVMLQWRNDGAWEHRAYWGANQLNWGVDGTESRQYMGPLPSAGTWVRLEVPARLVGLEGKQLNGMAFTLYGGGATWDYSGTRSASWQELIGYVPEFLQRTGISFLELVELLKTAFINPQPQSPEAITLFSPNSTCDLSITYLQHVDGTALNDPELSRMHRLIRLWRKLGWAMADVDRMLTALKANDTTPDVLHGFAIAAQLQADLNLPVQRLASLWANIDRQGDDALYNKLFLNKAVRKIDSVFEPKNDGSVLSDPGLLINHHVPALLAALRLSEGDFALIRLDAKLESDNAPLTLATVSSLYRYAALAKALMLRITEFLSLKTLSGIDPFAGPDLTQQFVALVRKVRDSGFRIAQLDYLYRHISQPPTGLAPQPTVILQLVKTLRDGLAKIQTDNVMVEDPRGEVTRSKLALIFESNIVDQAVRMVDGIAVYTTPLAALPLALSFPDQVKNKIAYDKNAKSLRYTGAMTNTELNLLMGLPQADNPFKQAVQALYDQPGTFIKSSLTGFLVDPNEAEKILLRDLPSLDQNGQPVLLDANDTPVTDPAKAVRTAIAKKFDYFLDKLLPYLRDKLSHSLAKQTLGDALKLDSATAAALLESILKSQKDTQYPAVNDVLDLATNGLSASYYANPSLSGSPAQTGVDKTIDFDGTRSTLPAGTGSVRWVGKLVAPGKDALTFFVRASGAVRLWLGDSVEPLIEGQSPNELASQPIVLKAGQLYDLRLEVTQLSAQSVVELRWQSATMPKDIMSESALCPETVLDTFTTTFTRLQKASMLTNGFALTADEVSYLFDAGHAKDFDNIDLQSLPLDRVAPNTVDQQAPGLFKSWQRLADYASLRNNLPRGQIRLIDVFSAASVADKLLTSLPTNLENDTRKQTALDIAKTNLLGATGWDEALVDALVGSETFKVAPVPPPPPIAGFKDERWLLRLRNCAAMIRRLGVSAPKLFSWASPALDFDSLQGIAQDIKRTVKAKYDDETWLTVAKPLSDKLREAQKNALIAYILTLPSMQQAGVLDADQLYEYFLIDVQMDACMQTSRIKQAISSVQLFVQRCLINLEDHGDASPLTVQPLQIDSNVWQWKKHYRMWEANRKVFLYPENWLEPELRDDKTSIFTELESELLQSDLSMDDAETALMNYLEKLHQIARLEICGTYWEDRHAEPGESGDILHVFGRTGPGKPHVYYYRQLINGMEWTTWEKVQIDIQSVESNGTEVGVEILPVVWNRRLYIFWPEFTTKSKPGDPSISQQGHLSATELRQELEVRLAWSELRNGKWMPKQFAPSSASSEKLLNPLSHHFRSSIDIDGQLHISDFYVSDAGSSLTISALIFTLTGCNGQIIVSNTYVGTFPEASEITLTPENTYNKLTQFHSFRNDTPTPGAPVFYIGDFELNIVLPQQLVSATSARPFFAVPYDYAIICTQQFPQYVLQTPFFYQDDLRTYFAVPSYEWDVVAQFQHPDKIYVQYHPELLSFNQEFNTRAMRNASIATRANIGLAGTWASRSASNNYNWNAPTPVVFVPVYHFDFFKHYHPYVCEFMKALNKDGIPGLLSIANQKLIEPRPIFAQDYQPTPAVNQPYPVEDVEFDAANDDKATYRNLPYGVYNWELFFHAPLLIATRLSKNQRFDSAMKWFHYIFNPMNSDSGEASPARYWNVLPFKSTPQENILQFMAELNAAKDASNSGLNQEVDAWTQHPFDPHLIARRRRIAYQKNVFMKYLDNLIAWGDQLFGQDTIESINEATQLYVLAADLLGPKPERIPQRGKIAEETYASLQGKLDDFANALVTLEHEFPFSGSTSAPTGPNTQTNGLLGLGSTLFFCIPQNEKLLGYWDTVADRLFKIRHCMNIAGVVRQLPLSEPPIDPALLVQAAAAGLDIGSVLSDINSPLPCYRFTYTLQKAMELCAELKSLGGALLSALEKKDAEDLAAKRAHHETQLLGLIKAVKEQQRDEALASADALTKSRDIAVGRYNYYQALLDEEPTTPDFGEDIPTPPIIVNLVQDEETGGLKLLQQEREELERSHLARDRQVDAASFDMLANLMHYIPEFSANIQPFGIGATIAFGGQHIGPALAAFSRHNQSLSAQYSHEASVAGKLGGHARQNIESLNQKNTAAREIMQIDKQIAAAKIRVDIALKEIDNQQTQIDNAQQIEDFLRTKFTNQDLYGWMEGTIAAVYFQAYQLVYDLAKKAEKAFRFERGLTESNFIKFGYWDSLHRGLLAGEQLYFALKQMESAYHEQNKREYEITKHVSLLLNDPMALIKLKETGQCEIFLPEALFDADYPGHYMRRIKSVSLTIPCVVGPYTSINCTLTLLSNKTRINSVVGPSYPESEDGEDERFVANFAAMQSIATSHAQNDSGMFELNFHDERYLPFEGAGVISRWRIDLPKDTNAFDFDTLTDVVLHLKYTAREGGDILRNAARQTLQQLITDAQNTPLARLFSLKHEFSNEWYRFLHPTDSAPGNEILYDLQLDLTRERFPFQFRGKITLNELTLFLKVKDGFAYDDSQALVLRQDGDDTPHTFMMAGSFVQGLAALKPALNLDDTSDEPGRIFSAKLQVKEGDLPQPGLASATSWWQAVKINGADHSRLKPDAIEDIYIICHYSITQ